MTPTQDTAAKEFQKCKESFEYEHGKRDSLFGSFNNYHDWDLAFSAYLSGWMKKLSEKEIENHETLRMP